MAAYCVSLNAPCECAVSVKFAPVIFLSGAASSGNVCAYARFQRSRCMFLVPWPAHLPVLNLKESVLNAITERRAAISRALVMFHASMDLTRKGAAWVAVRHSEGRVAFLQVIE